VYARYKNNLSADTRGNGSRQVCVLQRGVDPPSGHEGQRGKKRGGRAGKDGIPVRRRKVIWWFLLGKKKVEGPSIYIKVRCCQGGGRFFPGINFVYVETHFNNCPIV